MLLGDSEPSSRARAQRFAASLSHGCASPPKRSTTSRVVRDREIAVRQLALVPLILAPQRLPAARGAAAVDDPKRALRSCDEIGHPVEHPALLERAAQIRGGRM